MSATDSVNFPRIAGRTVLAAAIALVLAVFIWQGITSAGNPDPLAVDVKASPTVAVLDIAVLVFREGLECILVLSAITASMMGANKVHRKPVALGAGVGFLASLLTWFAVVGIVTDLSANFSALNVQAATGLAAIIVLLIVMNWFFHKIYWGGWIGLHTRRKRSLLNDAKSEDASRFRLLCGLGLLGFSSFYREGFEVVLFLQSYRLKLGGEVVLRGVLFGLLLTSIVAALTFIAHRRLPYRKMLVLTGVLLGVVLLVMVGEEAQEMQLAHWISTTKITALDNLLPAWAGLWFSIFPTAETIGAQAAAALLVVGSYWLAKGPAAKQACEADCALDPDSNFREGKTGECNPLCVSATLCHPRSESTPDPSLADE